VVRFLELLFGGRRFVLVRRLSQDVRKLGAANSNDQIAGWSHTPPRRSKKPEKRVGETNIRTGLISRISSINSTIYTNHLWLYNIAHIYMLLFCTDIEYASMLCTFMTIYVLIKHSETLLFFGCFVQLWKFRVKPYLINIWRHSLERMFSKQQRVWEEGGPEWVPSNDCCWD